MGKKSIAIIFMLCVFLSVSLLYGTVKGYAREYNVAEEEKNQYMNQIDNIRELIQNSNDCENNTIKVENNDSLEMVLDSLMLEGNNETTLYSSSSSEKHTYCILVNDVRPKI